MSVTNCRKCRRPFWSYKPSPIVPPAGYCSFSCWQARKRPDHAPAELDPEAPAAVLADIREHLLEAHQTADVTAWFECPRCESLQQRYASALAGAL